MKLISHYMESIAGIEIYPVLSLLIFLTLFGAATYYAFRLDKNVVKQMANSPLDENEDEL